MWGVHIAGIAGAIATATALLLFVTAGPAAANAAPMAEAGLDQEAVVNSTVYLDAGGSIDPDGKITSFEWSIERPNGTMTTPECGSCSLTRFVPMQPGRYNVTVTVQDDDGVEMSDTMYLKVDGIFLPPINPQPGNSISGGGSGAWGGGDSLDVVDINHESGSVWLYTDGNGLQLSGVSRDPNEYGANFKSWMTSDEVEEIVDTPFAEKYDQRVKVTGTIADNLKKTLDSQSGLEHKYKDAERVSSASHPISDVLNFDGGEVVVNDGEDHSPSGGDATTSGEDGSKSGSSGFSQHSRDFETPDYDTPSKKTHTSIGPAGCTMSSFCTSTEDLN